MYEKIQKLLSAFFFISILVIVDLSALPLQLRALALGLENFSFERARPWRFATTLFFENGNLSLARRTVSIFNRVEQAFPREFPVCRL